MITDIADAVKQVNKHIEWLGFVPRDADGNDFQRGDDRNLRFKTGTSYGEVAVQIVRDGKANPNETLRILNDQQVEGAMRTLGDIVAAYDEAKAMRQSCSTCEGGGCGDCR